MLNCQELAPIQSQKIEKFHDYVARQLGFKDGNDCPELCKLAYEYLKWDEGIDGKIYDYFSNEGEGEESAQSLFLKLVEEFERCILSYFSFHWKDTPFMISQVLCADLEPKGLRNSVMKATRKQTFENITKNSKVKKLFSTPVVEEREEKIQTPKVLIPHRNPIFLLVGGGMGAGKGTVLRKFLNKRSFWRLTAANAVMVELDVINNNRAQTTAEQTVNQSSKELLVRALSEGRDVIMNSTLSWEPFVKQTIAMARNIHRHRYRVVENDDGNTTENYWELVEEKGEDSKTNIRKPYRIEILGVFCDPHLAVIRSIRRAVQTGGTVNVKSLLKSHKRFAIGFLNYCQLVDTVKLYNTDLTCQQPKEVAWKKGEGDLFISERKMRSFNLVRSVNEKAKSIYELYGESDQIMQPGSVWKEIVLVPERDRILQELHTAINKIENSAL